MTRKRLWQTIRMWLTMSSFKRVNGDAEMETA